MGIPRFLWLCIIHFLFFFATDNVVGQYCGNDQSSALLSFKKTLKYNPLVSSKLISWNSSINCCSWRGITCKNSRVIALDLKAEGISGGLDNSSSLFDLQHLKSLNLAMNNFASTIPSAIVRLVNLEYLDLSNSGFTGQVPVELSQMTRLISLDLSSVGYNLLELQHPNLTMLVKNLSRLQELRLDGINISYYQRTEWSNVLSSSLPDLQVLSLSACNLVDPPEVSLLRLKNLSEISLAANNFSAPFPQHFLHFPNLKSLALGSCGIHGNLPEKLFHLGSLEYLDVSDNHLLQGTLPEFPQNMSLRTMVLQGTNVSGNLPDSIGNLHQLSTLDLSRCNFTGSIPSSIANLTQLEYLDLSANMFTGPLPNLSQLKNVTRIYLHRNSLEGTVASSLFELPFLQSLQLSFNQFSGMILEFSNASSSRLQTIDLSSNGFKGPVPISVYHLQSLTYLDLSFNNFSGPVELNNFQGLKNLSFLDLSHNNLSVFPGNGNFSQLPSGINQLKLASCSLRVFPNLRNHQRLSDLDLSNNQIQGKIPNWIWKVKNLNLSLNSLMDFEEPFPDQISVRMYAIDLHSNMLTGPVPIVPSSALYIDYSFNSFNSTMVADIGNYLIYTVFFSLSNNKLTGNLPLSICNASYIRVLDLSYNSLDGSIPSCLFNMSRDLGVLNLSGNKLKGQIPESFSSNCALKTLDLNDNMLEGQIPRTLVSCKGLEVLNLGKNQINDKFPCWLQNISNLRVLVLRSNEFYGPISCSDRTNTWKSLQIIDLAYNNFFGDLPPEYFLNWKAMSDVGNQGDSPVTNLHFQFLSMSETYYQDKVVVISKGLRLELVKILTIFTSIDLSCNKFQGGIPREIGQLNALYILNVSNNALTGPIPSSIGNLEDLESLDLSQNKLTGSIPQELAGLTFLSYLNLSFNELEGPIPRGNQFQTFSEASFQGNKNLCGEPTGISCRDDGISGSPSLEEEFSDSDAKIKWGIVLVFAEAGYIFGLGLIVVPLLLCRQWRNYYSWQLDKFLIKVFGMHPPLRRHICIIT
ncbi:hypothetical protein M9H77_22640 [Catharanthus roseus]|uniref:Uncharacterized protein n=1 Tax=Catharanthus roseus TaxID=4058 RepID=A0ACC0ATK7_CATRO|nr:hypothetical protein M9H77_22640 [Catharanthus roseus]